MTSAMTSGEDMRFIILGSVKEATIRLTWTAYGPWLDDDDVDPERLRLQAQAIAKSLERELGYAVPAPKRTAGATSYG